MRIETIQLHFATDEGASLSDITAEVNAFVHSSGMRTGLCILTLPSEGCCLTLTPDLDEGVDDLLRTVRSHLSEPSGPGADPEDPAQRDRLDLDGGGYAAAGIMADTLSLSIRDAALNLGSWDAVILLDGRGPVSRPVDVTIIGS